MTLQNLLLILLLLEVSFLVYKTGPSIRTGRQTRVYIDTSSLMDGRIVTAAQTGFLPSHIAVPRSVIHELQLLADQADHEKRSRARRGLDAIQELQSIAHMDVQVLDDGALGKGGVDERLIDLAKARGGSICTIDFNLNKAATALGIQVLNINELAGSIRMAFLPGETISMALTQKGQSSSQAVGYLADGTMVVVDKAAEKIGQTVEIEFIRSLQTAAGRMMFARVLTTKSSNDTADVKAAGRKPVSSATEDKRTVNTEKPKITSAPASRSQSRKKHDDSDMAADSKVAADTVDQKERTAPKGSRRRKSNRKSGEDSLIELVNQQD